jgi:hypothetical protein
MTRYSLTKGEVIRNENVTPNGTPALRKLINKGIEEHEQNGVIAPNIEASKFAKAFFPISHSLTLPTGKYDLKTPIIEIRTNKSNNIFTES